MKSEFSIPEHWQWVTIEEIQADEKRATITGPFGSSIGKRFFVDYGVPVIRGNNLTFTTGTFLDKGFAFITPEKAEELKGYKAKPGDLILTAAGTIGQVALIPRNSKYTEYIISNKQMRVRVNPNKVDPFFAYHWLSSPTMKSYIKRQDTGSTIPLINLSVLRDLPIPLPPLVEQQTISKILNSFENKIEINHKISELLEQIAQALFKSWFVDFEPVKAKMAALEAGGTAKDAERAAIQAISGKSEVELDSLKAENPDQYDSLARTAALFPSAMVQSELGEIPEGWGIQSIEDVLELRYGKALKRNDRVEGDFPVYGSGGISGTHNQAFVEGPGVIVGRKGTVGSVYWEDRDFYPIDTVYYVVPKEGFSMSIAFYLLQSLPLNSMNTDAAVPGLNRKNVYRLEVPAFPSALIDRFSKFIQPISQMIAKNRRESDTLADLRDTLLPKLLSGELEIPQVEEQALDAANA